MIARPSKTANAIDCLRAALPTKFLLGLLLVCNFFGCVEKETPRPTSGTQKVPLKASRSRGVTVEGPIVTPQREEPDNANSDSDGDSN